MNNTYGSQDLFFSFLSSMVMNQREKVTDLFSDPLIKVEFLERLEELMRTWNKNSLIYENQTSTTHDNVIPVLQERYNQQTSPEIVEQKISKENNLPEKSATNEDMQQDNGNSKKYQCNVEGCEKTFEHKWILDRHINSHFSFKLFKCDYEGCTKTYKSKENLNLHVKNKHMGIKPYQCRFCMLRFSHRNGKTYHERKVHINYLPHKCEEKDCCMSFASKSALNYHITSQHTG